MRKLLIWLITFLAIAIFMYCFADAKAPTLKVKKPIYSPQQQRALKQKANTWLVVSLWKSCSKAKSQVHCFWIGLSISKAESQMWNNKGYHWYFGRMWSSDKSTDWFVKSYNKHYYKIDKYNAWRLFYGSKSKSAPTHYCMSEDSSNTKGRCPNGAKNFDSIYQAYKKLFIDKDPKNEEYANDPKRPPKNIYKPKFKSWKK